jgi:RNA 2',3'-cyclic 3'-phosphodiesterase
VRLFVAIDAGAAEEGAAPHLTLAFLGEVPEARVAEIAAALGLVAARTAPFEIALEGIGAFPSRERPRVVWTGVTDGRAALERLAAEVRAALEARSVPFDAKPFAPHLTRLRVRSPADGRRARAALDGPPPTPVRIAVRAIHLKASTLTDRGAIHRDLATLALAATEPAARP